MEWKDGDKWREKLGIYNTLKDILLHCTNVRKLHTRMHTKTHKHTDIQTHTHKHIHTQTHTHAHKHIQKHTKTHQNTQTHKNTQKQTHIHTHTQINIGEIFQSVQKHIF